jgi:NAD(P)-dependent dehydrogenase (short-subunit alcohol dehydrogenase family)
VRSLAVQYAAYGIRINGVLPGPTETPLMWSDTEPEAIPGLRELVRSEVPLGRLAEPDEIAAAAVWLLSDDASYVTGSHVTCDGGVLARSSLSI